MGFSGMFALDLDRHPDAGDGVENFKALARASGLRLPNTRVHSSSGGGRHVFYKQNPDCLLKTSHSRVAAGVDILAGVALVMMPDTRGYRVLRNTSVAMIPLPTAREFARLTMTEPKRAHTAGVTGELKHSIGGLTYLLANAQQGTRNDVLHWCLCRAAEMPARKQTSALRHIRHEARMIGLSDYEIERTVGSVFGGRRG